MLVASLVLVAVTGVSWLLFLWLFHHGGLGGKNHAGHGSGVDHGRVGDLDWVNDAVINEVSVLQGIGIEAFAIGHLGNAGDDDSTVETGVFGDPERRAGQRAGDGEDADLCFALKALSEGLQLLRDLDQHRATAGDDAFFNGRAGRVDGVFDAQLALVDLGLCLLYTSPSPRDS